ncbi:TetR family transcriptional regulator [Catenovulum agarivorans DS-2]|uniref:TetR family transcriptional regulator n=1 Tax=Catenovulum agarivorans DS-2 TaxID=1328313 RepID=W7QJL4_9ALTE|nr:TetR/AcrR family transcriptional regulator [Catenovulum agarivorans]EWH09152.1 TetR family transcriptional regulator [Catenovulum agarivorans DS-2]
MAKAQFDKEQVVDKTLKLFWKQGFYATSMQNVVTETSLKPGSIYLAFGSKEALFKAALEHYAQTNLAQIRQTIDSAQSVGEGICNLLENMIEQAEQTHYCSCFLIKTQLEFASAKGDLYQFASNKLQQVEALFNSYLRYEYDEHQAAEKATSLMLHIFGLRVYGYQTQQLDKVKAGLRQGLPWLPWDNQ